MWRVEADVTFGESGGRIKRSRLDPFELNEAEFIARYRFSKSAVEELSCELQEQLQPLTKRSMALEPSLQVCTALYYYVHGGYLSVIGDLHDMSQPAASKCIHSVSEAICKKSARFIPWPDEDELTSSMRDFHEYTKCFQRVVGVIGGTHVPLIAPHSSAAGGSYVNSKGFHSFHCQILCNSKLKIYDFDVRWPGSTSGALILDKSMVSEKFRSGEISDAFILGDSSYCLSEWLHVPVSRPSTAGEERYNEAHGRARSPWEKCDRALKATWRCLTKTIMFRPERASRVIGACASLHNFALEKGLSLPEETDDDFEELMADLHVPRPPSDAQPEEAAIRIRHDLIRQLFS